MTASTREVGKASQQWKLATPTASGHGEGKMLRCRCKAQLCAPTCMKQEPSMRMSDVWPYFLLNFTA